MQIKHLLLLKCLRDSLILQSSSAHQLNAHRLWETMNTVYSLRLSPNPGVQPAADKTLSLRFTIEKMQAFAVLTKNFLRL